MDSFIVFYVELCRCPLEELLVFPDFAYKHSTKINNNKQSTTTITNNDQQQQSQTTITNNNNQEK